jgi:predicted short-subunit dehydrogenase-like oxidoreductase (DUF2520 family)
MTPAPRGDALWIVGPGRLGLALGLALHRAGAVRALSFSGRPPSPPAHPLFTGPSPAAAYLPGDALPSEYDLVLVAVPDDVLPDAAAALATRGLRATVPVLHTSGSRGAEVLAPLAALGHPIGSVHPLAAVSDPVRGADRLRGAYWGVEGDAAAAGAAERIVHALDGHVLRVGPGGKTLYHAAAVFASNYAVALLSVAEGLMMRGGADPTDARAALAALAAGAVRNVAEAGPAAALTGPIARGDAETVALHLSRLSADERAVYSVLGREALRLARAGGLDAAAADRLERLLGEGE